MEGEIVKLIQTVGFPIAAAIILAWFAWKTIQWERDQMMSVLKDNTETMRLVLEKLKNGH